MDDIDKLLDEDLDAMTQVVESQVFIEETIYEPSVVLSGIEATDEAKLEASEFCSKITKLCNKMYKNARNDAALVQPILRKGSISSVKSHLNSNSKSQDITDTQKSNPEMEQQCMNNFERILQENSCYAELDKNLDYLLSEMNSLAGIDTMDRLNMLSYDEKLVQAKDALKYPDYYNWYISLSEEEKNQFNLE